MSGKAAFGDICVCRRCGDWLRPGEPVTRLYVAEDPAGDLGLSGAFHENCAAPVWAFAAPAAEQAVLQ